jgi:Phosphoinositide phospholipase C, Ca2+-dependent
MIVLIANWAFVTAQDFESSPLPDELRLNQIQMIGTHNSYHLAPAPHLLRLISAASERGAEAIDYSHAPIVAQLNDFHIRQIELDVYADPEGGLFAKPIGKSMLGESFEDPRMDFEFDNCMSKPGMKILHSPGFDFATNVPTLIEALKQIQNWSIANPTHLPILVLIELKQDVTGPAGVKPVAFDQELLDAVDDEIRSVVASTEMLTPDQVRGSAPTLREVILNQGWPKLSECRGKLLFALDNEGGILEKYVNGHSSLEGRVMFASVPETHAAAAWMKINDPIKDFDKISEMVRKGFLVRTRADAETRQARENNTERRERAFASGAHFISTDYPVPDVRFSDYRVRFENNQSIRLNPITGER